MPRVKCDYIEDEQEVSVDTYYDASFTVDLSDYPQTVLDSIEFADAADYVEWGQKKGLNLQEIYSAIEETGLVTKTNKVLADFSIAELFSEIMRQCECTS